MKFEDRYSRQVLFPGIGQEGQAMLAKGRVAIIGCGATGACVSGLLARAGVGHLRIIDRDYVESSNLQRQEVNDEADAAESLSSEEHTTELQSPQYLVCRLLH